MKLIIALLVVLVLAGGAYAMLNAPDTRTTGEHIGDAIDNLDEGLDDAGRELKDSTPLERMQDGIEDATDGDAN